ncbi:MAG: hypothetical protein K0S76_3145 [Herbinix sp.]|jgi:hypothetical protein|nr:hypothetical protein [Herbinix sp.]
MNRKKVLEELAILLNEFMAHPQVGAEIYQHILGSGHEKEFIKLLTKQLSILKAMGYKATN